MDEVDQIDHQVIVDAICVDRHSVICIDDGGAGHHELDPSVLVQDFHLFVAVYSSSANYVSLTGLHEEWLDQARSHLPKNAEAELHATELANPKRKSVWKNVPMDIRLQLMGKAKEMLAHADQVMFGYIGEEQYRDLLGLTRTSGKIETAIAIPNFDDPNHPHHRYRDVKPGLELTFYKALVERIRPMSQTCVLIQDAGRLPADTVENIFKPGSNIWRDSVLHMDSSKVAGLQVADLLAWSINRGAVTKDRILTGKSSSPFCSVAGEIRELIQPKLVEVWGD
jgi:hypothetical protein